MFTANFTDKSPRLFISDIIEYFKSLLPAQLDLLSEVCKLLKLFLVMPATNAISDHLAVMTYVAHCMQIAQPPVDCKMYYVKQLTNAIR